MLHLWWKAPLSRIYQGNNWLKHLIIGPIIIGSTWGIGSWLGINIGHNVGNSVPYKWFITLKQFGALERGQYVIFQQRVDGNWGLLVKQIIGMPGDQIIVKPEGYWVGATYVGTAKKFSRRGKPLLWVAPKIIPDHQYFVAGSNPDSFDSRYEEIGLIKKERILSRAFPLW